MIVSVIMITDTVMNHWRGFRDQVLLPLTLSGMNPLTEKVAFVYAMDLEY